MKTGAVRFKPRRKFTKRIFLVTDNAILSDVKVMENLGQLLRTINVAPVSDCYNTVSQWLGETQGTKQKSIMEKSFCCLVGNFLIDFWLFEQLFMGGILCIALELNQINIMRSQSQL